MVGHTMIYGVLMTDEFGGVFNHFEAFVDAVKEQYGYNYPEWIASFPSAEDNQLALGFDTWINKTTDFKALDESWKELVNTIPEDLKVLIPDFEQLNPDVEVMSGKY